MRVSRAHQLKERMSSPQQLLCTPIQPGETATQVALRITGDAGSIGEPWFQIVDPATARRLAKESYDYVRPGWNACVAAGSTGATPRPAMQLAEPNLVLWAVLVASVVLATDRADRYFKKRENVLTTMRSFGQTFVREFERPLIARDGLDRPIQARLRCAPHAARLDILIAPGAGHRYPNLADHKHNVEYDLKRVLNGLRDQPFVSGRPYMDGPWVVLPFQLKRGLTQAGVT